MSGTLSKLLPTESRTFALFAIAGALLAIGVRSRTVETAHAPAKPSHSASEHATAAPTEPTPRKVASSADPLPPSSQPTRADDDPSLTSERSTRTTQPAPTSPMTHSGAPHVDTATGVLLDLGNQVCPVMGGSIDGTTHSDWNGLRVNHCCAGCSERFQKNPESLLDEITPSWREAAAAAHAIDEASGEVQRQLLAEAAERWTVLREPLPDGK